MLNQELYLVDGDLARVEFRSMRDGYGEGLVEAGERDERVVVVCADLGGSTRASGFEKIFPERYVEVGVAEQNMMGVAAGMALSGKIAFASSYAVFSPGRNWDQLRLSVCYSRANVKAVGSHAGISVGADGATHQALEDIAITRVLPNLTVLVPADYEQARRATLVAARTEGPVYLRLNRNRSGIVTTRMTPFEIGRAQVWRPGGEVSVFACGTMVYEALLVAEELADRIDVEVVNVHTIKPMDRETIVASARKTGRVVTVEEHQINGGLGGAVAEILGEEGGEKMVVMKRVGMRDSFGESGEAKELLVKYGMDKQAIVRAIGELMGGEK